MYASEEDSQAVMQHTRGMESAFNGASPAIVAFKIENGFVVRTLDMSEALVGSRQRGFHFCKDHQEIAEHIVASEAKRKLGIGEQQELFDAKMYQTQVAQAKRVPNRI